MLYFTLATGCFFSASAFSFPRTISDCRSDISKASKFSEADQVSRRDAVGKSSLMVGALVSVLQTQTAIAAMIANEDLNDIVVCVSSYRTPSYTKWRSEVIGPQIESIRLHPPKDVKVVRQIFAKSTNPSDEEAFGKDTVHSITVFPMKDLPAMRRFFDQSGELCTRGRREGWLLEPFDCNYFKSAAFLNARKLGAPGPIAKGSAFVFGGHGIGVPFDEWKTAFESPESIAFLEDFGVSGVSYGPSLPTISNVVKSENGIGIIDYFSSYADARRFTDILTSKTALYSGMTLAKGEQYFNKPLYLTAGEVTDDFIFS